MGFKTEFNWVLKLKQEQGLDEKKLKIGETYKFVKEEYRTYPVGIPIDLVNDEWSVIAKVIVTEFKNANNKTEGAYKLLKIYEGVEKGVLTKYWKENLKLK